MSQQDMVSAPDNPNRAALSWWRALDAQAQRDVARKSKPDWTFDMFTRSTFAVRAAHRDMVGGVDGSKTQKDK